jgi:hypothetical protein
MSTRKYLAIIMLGWNLHLKRQLAIGGSGELNYFQFSDKLAADL